MYFRRGRYGRTTARSCMAMTSTRCRRKAWALLPLVTTVVVLGLHLFPVNALAGEAAGATPGDIDVSQNGDAGYRIEIEVPPGIHGVEPKLALVYSSAGGNGHLGMGWSLSGLSAITRAGPTEYYDGYWMEEYYNRVSYDAKADG